MTMMFLTDSFTRTVCVAMVLPYLISILVLIGVHRLPSIQIRVYKETLPEECADVYTGESLEASWEFQHDHTYRRLTDKEASVYLNNTLDKVYTHRVEDTTLQEYNNVLFSPPPQDMFKKKRFPQCILLGFSKCGTSALLEFLQMHPDIETVSWEVNYFCDERYWRYGLEWYRHMMPPTSAHQTTIEKSPCYITQDHALDRIHAFNPNVKVMIIVRDPITRLQSSHSHTLNTARIHGLPSISFEDMYFTNGSVNKKTVLKWGSFADGIERVYQLFPRKQVLLLDGDKFISNPARQLNKVEDFLGTRRHFAKHDFYFDEVKKFYCYRSNRRTNCLGNNKGREHKAIDPVLETKLLDFLEPYTRRFVELSRHNFDWDINSRPVNKHTL